MNKKETKSTDSFFRNEYLFIHLFTSKNFHFYYNKKKEKRENSMKIIYIVLYLRKHRLEICK